MNTDNFTIDSSDIEIAQDICKIITNVDIRNRAVANAVAGRVAAKYFDPEVYSIDIDSGLHNIAVVLQDINISDIYINDAYVDVRVFFSDEEIAIPAEHVNNKLLPAAYMFLKLSPDLAGALVVGFKNPENIDKGKLVSGYYMLSESDLESFYDIEPLLSSYNTEPVEIDDRDIFAYFDNTLDDKNAFYSALLKSKEGRQKFAKAAKAQNVFKYISINLEEQPSDITNTTEQELSFVNDLELELESEQQGLMLQETTNTEEATEKNISLVDESTLGLSNNTEELITNDEPDFQFENSSGSIHEEISEITVEGNETTVVELTEEDLEVDLGQERNTEEDVSNSNFSSSEDLVTDNLDNKSDEYNYTTVASSNIDNSTVLDELSKESENTIPVNQSNNNSNEQIETLFHSNGDAVSEETEDEISPKTQSHQGSIIKSLLILTLLIVAGAAGYMGYTKILSSPPAEDSIKSITPEANPQVGNKQISDKKEAALKEEAMPIETVTTSVVPEVTNEAVSTSIPVIEQNLDASILVSNLKVDWEVPAGYASNTSAKRYLVKLGKIIQLQLKTELLLLSKPPITNKIAVEITYNSNRKKFEATGITISSGEKVVDDVILHTVNKALSMNLSTNTDSFAKLQGNPVLIIHL